MNKKRDTYRYTLRKGNTIEYIGITDDPERREAEHRAERMRFDSIRVEGSVVSPDSAKKWEEDRLQTYRDNHGGKNPRHNKTGDG